MVQQQQIDLDEKIAIATECLTPEYVKTFHSVSNEDDVLAITEYLAAIKTETNPSSNYTRSLIKILCYCSRHNNTRVLSFNHSRRI